MATGKMFHYKQICHTVDYSDQKNKSSSMLLQAEFRPFLSMAWGEWRKSLIHLKRCSQDDCVVHAALDRQMAGLTEATSHGRPLPWGTLSASGHRGHRKHISRLASLSSCGLHYCSNLDSIHFWSQSRLQSSGLGSFRIGCVYTRGESGSNPGWIWIRAVE